MRHKNSVLHGLLQHLPWVHSTGLWRSTEATRECGRCRCARSLRRSPTVNSPARPACRGIEGAFQSHEARLYHLNARPIKRSTLADANASRPVAVFTSLFAKLLGQAHARLAARLGRGPVY